MKDTDNSAAVHRFADLLASTLNSALAAMFATPSPLRVIDETTAIFRLIVDGALSGICLVEFRESRIEKLVAKAVGDPSDTVVGGHEELFRRIMETVTDGLMTYLSSKGEMVTVKLNAEADPHFKAKTTVSLAPSEVGQPALLVLLHIDSDLLGGICSPGRECSKVEGSQPRARDGCRVRCFPPLWPVQDASTRCSGVDKRLCLSVGSTGG